MTSTVLSLPAVLILALAAQSQTSPAIAYEAHTASGITLMVMNCMRSAKHTVDGGVG
jgi:hypothetical protein